MKEYKWKLSSISNIFFRRIFPVTAFASLCFTMGFGLIYIFSRYFLVLTLGMPIFAAFYAICHTISNNIEKRIIKRNCFEKVSQRYGLMIVMLLDFVLALLIFAFGIFDIIKVIQIESIDPGIGIIYTVGVAVLIAAVISALCKISIIKFPVKPKNQNNGPQPPNPWNRYY